MAGLRQVTHMDNVKLGEDRESVVIVDQTLLPDRLEYLTLREPEEMFEAIRALRVRGAPAIGIFAGYCLAALARQGAGKSDAAGPGGLPGLLAALRVQADYLASSRPTAVNLSWALRRMLDRAQTLAEAASQAEAASLAGPAPADIAAALEAEARAIHDEDIRMCRAISEYGLSLLKDGDGVLTHCNAGPLATSRYGTAQGPLFLALEKGVRLRVFADETRPLLQGARLTSYELARAGADVTLICDNMASIVMKNGWVDACFVGCDRVAANGDTANKIGTSGVAILARHYGIPFYVLGPTSTIDLNCPDGGHIPIELRDPEEIKSLFYARPVALPEVKCYNPAFDVTDHTLITGIVTERGICCPPYSESLRALFE